MPSKSAAQARTMAAAAHDPEFAAKMGIPQTVAKEFNQADAGHSRKELPEHVRKKTAQMLKGQRHG